MSKETHNLEWAHPLVREWFLSKVGVPTEPQAQGWPHILAKRSVLISAPTGSGKTLAAFLPCINQLVVQALQGDLDGHVQVLYVSPLKALSNDVEKNLIEPLDQIFAFAKERGHQLAEIRVGLRTGDTPNRLRVGMVKKPPHILVTTPESLYILLTAQKSREILKSIHTVIVDEIHALARDKRGVHLSLTLERLEALTEQRPLRIGLSATQKPLDLIAQFLTGSFRPAPQIINIGHKRDLEMAIEVPSIELGAVASNEMWEEIYDRLAQLASENRSTLIFTNTRKLAERIAHNLTSRLGEDQVCAHHGSLSRKLRLEAETKLKEGRLRALVATASLELGIDIGKLDLVCQIGSPRAIATALQRVGRAGHWHGGISKGRFFATTRDELLECAALVHAIQSGDLDKLILPRNSLDILSQQIVATVATGTIEEERLFTLVKNAFPYKELTRDDFEAVLEMLAEGVSGTRGRYGTYVFRDRVNGVVSARRQSRLVSITNGGAIADNGLFTVIAEPQNNVVGTLDEDFAIESSKGEIILLGTTSWRINRIEAAAGRVVVEDAHGAPPNVPFWRGEAPGRTIELSSYVSNLRTQVSALLPGRDESDGEDALIWLKNNACVDESGARQIIEYVKQGRAMLGVVPSQDCIVAERFFDESGGMQLVIHSPFGARINKAWGLALRKKFCRNFNFELQAAATDDGLNISLAEQHSFPLEDVFNFVHPNTLKETLVQAVLQSPLFNTRWRWIAQRSLALMKYRNGKKIPPNISRMLSDDLLAAVFPNAAACQDNLGGKDIELPNHPLVNEAMNDALTEALDVEGLGVLLRKVFDKSIRCVAVDTPMPSVFAHEILNANPYAFLDDAPLEERRARAVELRRVLPDNLKDLAKLDPEAIAQVQRQAWPDVRSADELHDLLQSLIAIPVSAKWQSLFDELMRAGRATEANVGAQTFWVPAERRKTFGAIYPQATFNSQMVELESTTPESEEALVQMVRHWMQNLGPSSSAQLCQLLKLDENSVDAALIRLESTGLILRGNFTGRAGEKPEWCERRLLARIHRLTIDRLRKEIEPSSATQFMHWLTKWQHVAPGSQLRGELGLLAVIKQLQGFELPANAWEHQIFKQRIADYKPRMLDRLCAKGLVGWGRISTHPALAAAEASGTVKTLIPRSVAPITFFVREESDWILSEELPMPEELTGLSVVAKSIYAFLKQRGASFFADIVRGVNRLRAEVEGGLWELVVAGIITADDFDNLRVLLDSRRRNERGQGLRNCTGRWSVLYRDGNLDAQKRVEACAKLLLTRYGVVFRDLVARERNMPEWRELFKALRQMEDRGEIRGGHFVRGFVGEQFALSYAVDSLRAAKKEADTDVVMHLSAVDPLNLAGIILPGGRVPAISGKSVRMKNGMQERMAA